MKRWVLILLCGLLGLLLLGWGLRVPAHLRAVDRSVLAAAGKHTLTLTAKGLDLAGRKNLGAAQLFAQTAQAAGVSDGDKLAVALEELVRQQPDLIALGHDEPGLKILFGIDRVSPAARTGPITDFLVRQENRHQTLDLLRASPNPVVQELLRFRTQTNTVLFSPSPSASGQALDTAIAVGGLLLERGRLTTGLSNAVLVLAADANSRRDSVPLEQLLLDLMSLGQRFNWGQLLAFAGPIEDAETLRRLTVIARNGENLPELFCAVQLSGEPARVAQYLMNFSQTGLRDLSESLRYGAGGVNELLRRKQRLHGAGQHEGKAGDGWTGTFLASMSDVSLRTPWLALTAKWLLYLGGGFLLAVAAHYARRVPQRERPLQVRGLHFARESLFALGFLLLVLLLSEPFLAQESQKVDFPLRLRLPTVGSAVPAMTSSARAMFMTQSILTLILFFVIQSLIYASCLVKLAEIRRQNVPARIKLKLLENEDHLFDAGLYLGFVGTIISLILVSLGVIKLSLMAGYSSTSFGIIFVSVFKIFHLRPLRRKLLLEAEAVYPEPPVPAAAPTYATPS